MLLSDHRDAQTAEEFLRYFRLSKKEVGLSFLSEIVTAFSNLPYENVTKILKISEGCRGDARLRLPAEVWRDYLKYKSGGTCFSLSFFLHTLLKECGFISQPIMADRSYGKNTHCALLVTLSDGIYLLDPGFLIQKPVPLKPVPTLFFPMPLHTLLLAFDAEKNIYDFHTVHQGVKRWRCRYKNKAVTWNYFLKCWEASFDFNAMNSVVMTSLKNEKQIYVNKRHVRIVKPTSVQKQTMDLSDTQSLQNLFEIHPSLVQRAYGVVGF